MDIATFNATTGWAGKTISYDGGVFLLAGHGAVPLEAVMDYDRRGQIDWAYPGLREWALAAGAPPVGAAAGGGVAAPQGMQPAPAGAQTEKRGGIPPWAIVLIILAASPIVVGLLAAIAIPMFLNQRDLAKDSAVKEGIHSIQIGVQSWAVDHQDVYPDLDQVTQDGMARYIDNWPTNPYTGRPMAPGSGKGDYSYAHTDVSFQLSGHLGDGSDFVVP